MRFLATLLLILGVGCAGSVKVQEPVTPENLHRGKPRLIVEHPKKVNAHLPWEFAWMLKGHPQYIYESPNVWVVAVNDSVFTMPQSFDRRYYRFQVPADLALIKGNKPPYWVIVLRVGLYPTDGHDAIGRITFDPDHPVVTYDKVIRVESGSVAHIVPLGLGTHVFSRSPGDQ